VKNIRIPSAQAPCIARRAIRRLPLPQVRPVEAGQIWGASALQAQGLAVRSSVCTNRGRRAGGPQCCAATTIRGQAQEPRRV
jgi:hypothetical protein